MEKRKEFNFFMSEIDKETIENSKKVVVSELGEWLTVKCWDWLKENDSENNPEMLFADLYTIPQEYYNSIYQPEKEMPLGYTEDEAVLMSPVLATLCALYRTQSVKEILETTCEDEAFDVLPGSILKETSISEMPIEKRLALEEMLVCNYLLKCILKRDGATSVEWQEECQERFSTIEEELKNIRITKRNVTQRSVQKYKEDESKAYQNIFCLWQEKENMPYMTSNCFMELKIALLSCIAMSPLIKIDKSNADIRTSYDRIPKFFSKYTFLLNTLLKTTEESLVYRKLTLYLSELITAESFVHKAAAVIISMSNGKQYKQIAGVFSKLYCLPGIRLRLYYCDRLYDLYLKCGGDYKYWKHCADGLIREALQEVDQANSIFYVLSNGLPEYSRFYSYYIANVLNVKMEAECNQLKEYKIDYQQPKFRYGVSTEEIQQYQEEQKRFEKLIEENEVEGFRKELRKREKSSLLQEIFAKYVDISEISSDCNRFEALFMEGGKKDINGSTLPEQVKWTLKEKRCVSVLYAGCKELLEEAAHIPNGERLYVKDISKEGTPLISLFIPKTLKIGKLKKCIKTVSGKSQNGEKCTNGLELYNKICKDSGEILIRYILWESGGKEPDIEFKPEVQYFTDYIKRENLESAIQEALLYAYGIQKFQTLNIGNGLKGNDFVEVQRKEFYKKILDLLKARTFNSHGAYEITRTKLWEEHIEYYNQKSWFNEIFSIEKERSFVMDSFLEELQAALLVSVMDFPLNRTSNQRGSAVGSIKAAQRYKIDYYSMLKPTKESTKEKSYWKLLYYTGALIEAGDFVEGAADFILPYLPNDNIEIIKLYLWCIPQIYALPGVKLRQVALEKVTGIISTLERTGMTLNECEEEIKDYIAQIRSVLQVMCAMMSEINQEGLYDRIVVMEMEKLLKTDFEKDGLETEWNDQKLDIIDVLYRCINLALEVQDISMKDILYRK